MGFRIAAAALAVAGLAAMGQANAQYYPPPGPPGPPPPPYGAPPPPPPPYGYGYGPPGSRCNAHIRTYYGPRRVVCPMGVAKPVGAPCTCPPPGPDAPPAHGRVIP